jgi:hypothetical protein
VSLKFRMSSLTVRNSDTVESIMQGLLSTKDIAQLNKIKEGVVIDSRLDRNTPETLFSNIESILKDKSLQLRRLTRLITVLLGEDSSVLNPSNVPTFSHLAAFLETVPNMFKDATSITILSLYRSAFTKDSNANPQEVCEICDGNIEFTGVTDAKCVNGHEFCKLTLHMN